MKVMVGKGVVIFRKKGLSLLSNMSSLVLLFLAR